MRFIVLPALLLVALVVPNLHAQSSQLEKNQMAVVRFDIDVDKIRNSEMSKTFDLESKIQEATSRNSDNLDPAKVKRFYGGSSAPESIKEAQGFMKGEGSMPVEFFARVELVDPEATDEAMKKIQEKGEAVEIGGKTFYKSADEDAPTGLLAHRVDSTTIEMGTETYLTRSDRKVYSDGLDAAFKKAPDEAVRIAMDLEGAPELVAELQKMAEESGPPSFAALYELIGAISDMHITFDMAGANLLTIGVTGKSESQAEDLEGGLGSLIGMGQMAGMVQLGQIKQVSPDLADKAQKMLEALKATREGKDVSIKLIHPEGLADAIKGMASGG